MFPSGPAQSSLAFPDASTQVSNWEQDPFLQDLDFGHEVDNFPGFLPQNTVSDAANSASVKAKNRQAQKRFRQRKKVRAWT